jgi:hypothetical protein
MGIPGPQGWDSVHESLRLGKMIRALLRRRREAEDRVPISVFTVLRATRHVQLGVLWESEAVGDALLGRALTKDVVVTIAPGAF